MSLVVNAGVDQTVEYADREHIQLDGSSTTVDSTDATYSWTLYGEEIGTDSVPDEISLEPGTYVITLVVVDGANWDYDFVNIVVEEKPLNLIDLMPDKFKVEI